MLGFECQSDPPVQTRPGERGSERVRLLADTRQVVRVQRRAVLASDRFRVATGDRQATAPDVESGAGPPRACADLSPRHGGSAYRSDLTPRRLLRAALRLPS